MLSLYDCLFKLHFTIVSNYDFTWPSVVVPDSFSANQKRNHNARIINCSSHLLQDQIRRATASYHHIFNKVFIELAQNESSLQTSLLKDWEKFLSILVM